MTLRYRGTRNTALTADDHDYNLRLIGGWPTVAAMLGDPVVSYSSFPAGTLIRAAEFRYEVLPHGAPAAAVDLTTTLGLKLRAVPDAEGFLTFRQLGAVGDGTTNDREAIARGAGRKVRGTPGDTYYIALSQPSHSIRVGSKTHWVFPRDYSCRFLWDFFGLGLFYFHPDDRDSTVEYPFVVWNGTVPTRGNWPFTSAEMLTVYGGGNSATSGFIRNWRIGGADNITLIGPRCASLNPGPGKSMVGHIGLRAKDTNPGTRGSIVTIDGSWSDDFTMGIQGSGFDHINLPGHHYGGRYDEYWWDANQGAGRNPDLNPNPAPGHLIYLSNSNIGAEHVTIGDIYDRGEYLGSLPGRQSLDTLKLRKLNNGVVGSVFSKRPHGMFSCWGLKNWRFGPMRWESDHVQGTHPYSHAASVINMTALAGDAETRNEDCVFDTVSINYTGAGHTRPPFQVAGVTGVINRRIRVGRLQVYADVSALQAPVMQFTFAEDCSVDRALLELRGTPVNSGGGARLVSFINGSARCVVNNVRLLGPTRWSRVDATAYGNHTPGGPGNQVIFDADSTGIVQTGSEIQENPATVTSGALPLSGSSTGANLSGGGTSSFTLPSPGIYMVTVTANAGTAHARAATFLARWWPGGNDIIRAVEKIGGDVVKGSNVTGITGSLTLAGRFDAAISGSGTINMRLAYTRIGVLPS